MKKVVFTLLILARFLCCGQDEGCFDLKQLIQNEQLRFSTKKNLKTASNLDQYDISFHRLDLTVDPKVRYIKGVVTTYFSPKTSNFKHLTFDLIDSLKVLQVLHQGQPLSFTHQEQKLTIAFQDTIALHAQDSVSISYQGRPEQNGFESFTVSEHEDQPVMWTLSEPYGAKTWWPCKEILTDKIDSLLIIIRAPNGYKAASNGMLVSEISDSTTTTTSWKHQYPIAHYLIAFSVSNYLDFTDYASMGNGDSVPILNYVYPENISHAQTELKKTTAIMELFNRLFGPYPFAKEKYGHADFGWGGGMEHQTMSFMGSYSFDLVTHELAHQWFGNKITCASWSELWLNEGFATYASGLAYENLDDFYWLPWKKIMMDRAKIQADMSIFIEDTSDVQRMFNENTYYKGAALLHMLRWKIGDEALFGAVLKYLQDPQLSYSTATTNELKTHFEKESSENLTEFFNDWYLGKGFPSYQFSWNFKNGHFLLKANQSSSHESVAFFEMPIPIRVYGSSQDSLLRLSHDFNGQLFQIELPFEVDSVSFNDDLMLLTGNSNIKKEHLLAEKGLQSPKTSIFPNPSKSHFTVTHFCENCQKKISCTNQVGELIFELDSYATQEIVDASMWASGSYFLTVQDGFSSTTHLIVKH